MKVILDKVNSNERSEREEIKRRRSRRAEERRRKTTRRTSEARENDWRHEVPEFDPADRRSARAGGASALRASNEASLRNLGLASALRASSEASPRKLDLLGGRFAAGGRQS